MKRIIPFIVFAVFALIISLAGLPASPAYAFDPPWPGGIPWPTTVAWPTASPLTIGVPWSPPSQSFPVYVATPVPPAPALQVTGPLPLPSVAPAVPVAGALPLPPVVGSGSGPLPPIASSSNVAPSSVAPSSVAPSLPDSSGGSTQATAYLAGDTWRTLGAGGVVWYRVGASGEHMDVWLDATPHAGVSMAIFAPNGGDHPIGQGTPFNADPTRLLWSGGHWDGGGYWYARITNSNPVSVQYRVTSSQQDIGNRSCFSYWEYLVNSPNPVYWTECNR